ncbi:PREDICTED: uncharacterized protein LOC109237972 [Nicotiana attenuata]|uniref:uncharacterized protein LOC109237972 n=1 Tax=Nicotiana attenuata TaxID=49451 RepID=UPI000905B7E8|nr:PREDICTED: uncharacterized protein LOC109237972 [Nicotiana attenuata]
MAKGTRSSDNSIEEPSDLRELMQKLVADVGALVGEVSNLRRLDQTVPTQERVEVAAMQLEGEDIQWHLAFMRYRQYLQPATWTEYVMAMVERSGVDFDDPMEEIKKIRQTGTVKEYQAIFERNLTRVNLSQENAISCFLGGLKHELNIAVKLTNPTTLSQVYKTARMQEAYLAALRQPPLVNYASSNTPRKIMDQRNNSRPLLPTPSKGNFGTSKGFNKRTLCIEEMNEKWAKGLCDFCNEKYVPGHKCKNAKQIYVLELEGTEDGHDTEVKGELILQRGRVQSTGTSSTHRADGDFYPFSKWFFRLQNSEDPDLVHHLGCKIRSTTPQMVAAANGNMMVDIMYTITWLLQGAEFSAEFLLLPLGSCGVVLGVQWLLTLGDITMNFRKLTIEFWYKGRKHLLRGAGNQVRVQEARKIAKHTGNTSQLCMIQVVPMESVGEQWHALKAKEEPKTDIRLTHLLYEYSKLFEEPTELPPSRGVFDHRIVLYKGTEPVNKRPNRYPSVKKDIIEGLVQQMLNQGIIQPTCSPFASPVVLVGKKDGTWRLCVDYMDLHIVKKKFPIPIVEDLLDELGDLESFLK